MNALIEIQISASYVDRSITGSQIFETEKFRKEMSWASQKRVRTNQNIYITSLTRASNEIIQRKYTRQ